LHIGRGVLAALGSVVREAVGDGPMRVMLAADPNVSAGAIATATLSLEAAGFEVIAEDVRATEADKSLQSAERLLRRLASERAERGDPVIALGGGVTGDLAGFVASTYRRGAPLVQCPTTLLAMVDASIGGKTAVNLPTDEGLIKNTVGSFHHPRAVLLDVETLASLPTRHLSAGLAECLKHGLLSAGFGVESNLFAWTCAHLERFLELDLSYLIELVARNARVKAAVVNADPDETAAGGQRSRALLNLGHTFAHAIETLEGVSPRNTPEDAAFGAPLVHGEAVAVGLVAAANVAAHLELVTPEHAATIREAVESLGVCSRLEGLPADEVLLGRMMHDKKVSGGRLRLVLPCTSVKPASVDAPLGVSMVVRDPPREAVSAGLAAIRA
jgi:3-dehydroquinate synthase